jgi:hypothetical protein
MADAQHPPSPTRERLRLAFFPELSPEEGRRRIDTAFERADDEERVQRIERLANDPDLDAELLRTIRRLSSDELDELI